ncbi:MAG TPA: hypothetical protein RMI62_17915, partial [Polyangiaceae bacterium LLY-WYZ-15_(1-7)]|nr:hypothetical protein [Polyangiaceae bacterium LLY-WYZ-15_(1-7)]
PLEPASEPLSEPVPVRAFLRAPGGELEAWDAPLERAPGGAVRVAGTAASLFGARRGPIEVFFVLGDAAEGDAAEGDAAEGGEPDPDAPHVHRVVIQVEDAPVEDAP